MMLEPCFEMIHRSVPVLALCQCKVRSLPCRDTSVLSRYERPASAKTASSFSFAGDRTGVQPTPELPGAEHSDFGQQPDQALPDEVQGPVVTCHCGLACNRLEAKTEKNMGR